MLSVVVVLALAAGRDPIRRQRGGAVTGLTRCLTISAGVG